MCQPSLLVPYCPSLHALGPELEQNSLSSCASIPKPALALWGCEIERGNINPKPKPGAGSRLRTESTANLLKHSFQFW